MRPSLWGVQGGLCACAVCVGCFFARVVCAREASTSCVFLVVVVCGKGRALCGGYAGGGGLLGMKGKQWVGSKTTLVLIWNLEGRENRDVLYI